MTKIFALLSLALLAACGGSTGKITVQLTDAPADLTGVKNVNITYDELRVHDEASDSTPSGGPAAAADGVDGKGWIVLCSETRTVDLLALAGGKFTPVCTQPAGDGGTEVKAIEVPAGRISQLRLHVAAAQLVFNDNSTVNLDVPSGGSSGLKINVHKDVPKGGTLDLKLDFDAAQSITRQGTGTYKLSPVLKVID